MQCILKVPVRASTSRGSIDLAMPSYLVPGDGRELGELGTELRLGESAAYQEGVKYGLGDCHEGIVSDDDSALRQARTFYYK